MRKILVVGGLHKNIPNWIRNSFEVDHYPQETHFKRDITSDSEAIVILKSWISHKQFSDAVAFGEKNSIPVIVADNGWSSAIQRAIESGLTWFAQDIDKALSSLPDEVAKAVDTTIERAWELAYKRESEKANALERRLKKDRIKLEDALGKLDLSEKREDAASRVIYEVREAARLQKLQHNVFKDRQEAIIDVIRKLIILRDCLDIQQPVVDELEKLKGQLESILDE